MNEQTRQPHPLHTELHSRLRQHWGAIGVLAAEMGVSTECIRLWFASPNRKPLLIEAAIRLLERFDAEDRHATAAARQRLHALDLNGEFLNG